MRFARFALAAFAAAFCLIAAPDHAQVVQSDTRYDTVLTTDPSTMTTAVAFTYPSSGTLDTGTYSTMTCEVSVTAGNTRSIIPKCYAESAGTNLTFTYPTMTVAAAATGRYVFDARTSAATADTGVTDSPNVPCRFIKITAASAGEGIVSCTLRKR
jgi:hypothetical protein